MEMKKNLNFESDEELILVQPSEKYMPELSAYKKDFLDKKPCLLRIKQICNSFFKV